MTTFGSVTSVPLPVTVRVFAAAFTAQLVPSVSPRLEQAVAGVPSSVESTVTVVVGGTMEKTGGGYTSTCGSFIRLPFWLQPPPVIVSAVTPPALQAPTPVRGE